MIEVVRRFARDRFGWTDLYFDGRADGDGWIVWPCGMGERDGVLVPFGQRIEPDVQGRLFEVAAEYRRRCEDSGQKWCSGCRSWRPTGGGFTVQFYDVCLECRERRSLGWYGYSADDYERKVAYEQKRSELLMGGRLDEWVESFDWDVYCLGKPDERAARTDRMNRTIASTTEDKL